MSIDKQLEAELDAIERDYARGLISLAERNSCIAEAEQEARVEEQERKFWEK